MPSIFPHNIPVIGLTSDASVDFTPTDFDAALTETQKIYLKTQTGMEIPQVFWRKQVHGDDVVLAKGDSTDCRACPDADAFVTNQKNLPIAIRTADCVPVFIVDPIKHVIGLAHAGWRGTQKQITLKTIQTMKDKFGCQCYDLRIALGPAIGACCYEVGPEFKQIFPQDIIERSGKIYLDTAGANYRQLIVAGIKPEHVTRSTVCTFEDHNYFSFRRDGAKSGRMISLLMLI